MAKIVTITNPLTGQPAQVDQLDHTAQEIDDAIARALPGGAIDITLQIRRLYFVSGLLLDANGDTIEGVGTATINVDTNGIARIDFSIKITQTYTTSTFDFGINPALFTAKNANIPTITPVDGGTLVMISSDSKYAEGNEYGATFQTELGRWRPSRMYNTEGGIGGWASANLDAGMVLTGTCYGTVNN